MTAPKMPVASRRRHKGHFERGAAAVEMALVLPVLLFLLMAMIDFGRAYNAQIQVSAAAREGVRLAALNVTPASAGATTVDTADVNYGVNEIAARVQSAAGGLGSFTGGLTGSCPSPNSACITYCPAQGYVAATDNATVVVTANFRWITGISAMSKFFGSGAFPTPQTVQATGVMRCTG